MGKLFPSINPELEAWIYHQQMFFVATAPLSVDGHINCSPKGLDSFRIITPTRVAYQDLTGSGVETIAHLQENSRIVFMFCAFDGKPKIVRLHGKGRAVLPGTPYFDEVSAFFPLRDGVRSYIVADLTRISDSCGFGVPLYDFKAHRKQMEDWAEAKGPDGIKDYQHLKNAHSIDGLRGL